jgi:hypothetical protein
MVSLHLLPLNIIAVKAITAQHLPYTNPYSGDSWQSTTQKLIIENQDTKSEDQVYLYQKYVPNMIQKP